MAGLCSIIYELLVSATATYFLGDGVRQFSILIGVYLFSMGVGSYFSKYLKGQPLVYFVLIEYLLGFVGGLSVPILYLLFVTFSTVSLQVFCLIIMFLIGILTGMEVPLLTFINKDEDIESSLSNVLSVDYIGGLIATLIFPFILLPFIGIFFSSLIFGLTNLGLGLFLNYYFYQEVKKRIHFIGLFFTVVLLIIGLYASTLLKLWDEKIYKAPILANIQTPYQKIVLTKNDNGTKLYLNRTIQFSSNDEYRYHELLVHVPMCLHPNPKTILVLGGGENLASRELLKYPSVSQIDVVDIDSMMFHLAINNHEIKKINRNAAIHAKVNLIVDDAFLYLRNNLKLYDIIICDLPDPSSEGLARLYSKQFFDLAKRSLQEDGIMVTQSGEINFSNTAFNCIRNTVASSFEQVKVYQGIVPSFGNWGFTLGSRKALPFDKNIYLPQGLKFVDSLQFKNAFIFPKDIPLVPTKINTLDHPILLTYFLDEWQKWKVDLGEN